MSIWGKILGGAAGLAVGGPLGALIGAVAGHFAVDQKDGDGPQPDRRVFRTAPDEERNVARLFNQAKRDVAGFESYAQQLAHLLRDSPLVLEQVLDCLFVIATADGEVHPDEMRFLRRVAEIFGISAGDFARIRETHLGEDESDPYTILGVKHDTPLEQIRAKHRQLVRENHPDRLMAQGMPQEAVDVATAKAARINAAWDQVRKKRAA